MQYVPTNIIYPPTLALAKAGAAPGTTGGVEPALSRPWPSHSSNNCLSVFAVCHASSASNAPRQLPRPNLPAGLSKATLAATRPRQCFKPFHKPFQGNSRSYRPHRGNSRSYRPQTSASNAPRQLPRSNLPAGLSKATLAATRPRQCFKPFHRPFQGNSRSCRRHRGNSRSYRPQTLLQTSASLSTATLAATGPSHLFLRAFKTAICPAFKPLQAQPSVLRALKTAVCPASNPSNPWNPPAGLQGNSRSFLPTGLQGNSRSYTPQTMLQTLPQLFQSNSRSYRPPAICFKGVQDRLQAALPAFKPLQAPAFCF